MLQKLQAWLMHVLAHGCSMAPLAPPLAMTPDAFCSVAGCAFQATGLEKVDCQQEGGLGPAAADLTCSSVPEKAGLQRHPSSWRHLLSSAAAKVSTSRMSV